jgi:tRNA(fMet)-specific endonuclease VapC
MFVLDTDMLTLLFTGHPRVTDRRHSVSPSDMAITVVTWIEAVRGRCEFVRKAATGQELLRAQALLDLTMRSLAALHAVVPIETAAAAEFDRLRANKKLKKIGRADLLIASIALAKGATLVTRNLKHFRQVPGLQLENWAD